MLILWFVVAVFVLWIVRFRVRRRRMYELASRIPGPKEELPIIGIAHTLMGNTEEIMTTLQYYSMMSTKNNGIGKSWLGHRLYILLTDPKDLEYCLNNCLEKDDLQRFIRNLTGNGVTFAPVPIWRKRRKILVPVFSPKNLDEFVEVLWEQSQKLTECLESQANGKQFSVWPHLSSYTLDSVCESAMGVKVNNLKNSYESFLKAINKVTNLMSERIFHMWLQPEWLYKLFPQHLEHQKCIKFIHGFIDKVINENLEELKIERNIKTPCNYDLDLYRRCSFLDLLISNSGGVKGYNEIELREEVMNLILAGTDTSAATIGYVMKLLAKYPDVQEKVYLELQSVFDNSNRPLVKEDLVKLQYLERVIKETMRLFPTAPFIVRKVLKETTLPSGRILPAGSGVMVSIWGVHRDPKYWGPDVENFDPDRFLPERFKLLHSCSYMPFSSGPRKCVGYRYAMMVMKTGLSAILRRFRIVEAKDTGDTPAIRVQLDITMKAVDGYKVALENRNSTTIKIS